MGEALKRRIRQVRFENAQQEALLNLIVASNYIRELLERAVGQHGITLPQYNVLRILRGAPEGLPCGEIANRMITRDPDVTRLLDRLEKRSLISRCRETKDRRTVMVRITPAGLKLLARLDTPVQDGHRRQLGHLGREQLKTLTELLRMARSRVA
jgi:DNA-binding MarR family transcriptional regulator